MSVAVMTDHSCQGCAAPLASNARSCRVCGAVVSGPRRETGPAGRRVLLNTVSATDAAPLSSAARTPPRPPVRRDSRAARRPARRASAGPVAAGTVTGDVHERVVDAVGAREIRRAAAAGVIAAAAVATLLVLGGARRSSDLMFLLPTLVVLAALLVAPFVIPRSRARTPVRRFRITELSGRVLDCELWGRPDAAPPTSGDVVEVFGRARAVVRIDEIVRGDERLHGRPPVAFQIARHSGTVALALAAVCAVGVLAVVAL